MFHSGPDPSEAPKSAGNGGPRPSQISFNGLRTSSVFEVEVRDRLATLRESSAKH